MMTIIVTANYESRYKSLTYTRKLEEPAYYIAFGKINITIGLISSEYYSDSLKPVKIKALDGIINQNTEI